MGKRRGITLFFIILFLAMVITHCYIEWNTSHNVDKEMAILKSMKSPLLINIIDKRNEQNTWILRSRLVENKRWGLLEVCYPKSGIHAGWTTKKEMGEANFLSVDVSNARSREREVRHHLIQSYLKFPGDSMIAAEKYIKQEMPAALENKQDTIAPEVLMNHLETIWLQKLEPALMAEAKQERAFILNLTNVVMILSAIAVVTNSFIIRKSRRH